jgi:hypothetical protein
MTNEKEITLTIRSWKLEASNFRNDGWCQEGYRQKIEKVYQEAEKALSELKKPVYNK